MKYDIIIPTWNSMPEFERCLKAITNYIPEENRGEIIVVDRYSTDGTIEIAEKYGCKIFYDDISLGSARMKGIKEAKTEWIIFIDSDIGITENWFNNMMLWMEKLKKESNLGWFFGRPLDTRDKIRKMQIWESKHRTGFPGGFKHGANKVPFDAGGYTHNTICLREPLLDADIRFPQLTKVSGFEDRILSKVMMSKGYDLWEVPVYCWHLKDHVSEKWGDFTVIWNYKGKIEAGIKPSLMEYAYLLKKGIQFSLIFKDFWYFKYFTKQFLSVLKFSMNPKEVKRLAKQP